MSYDKGKTIREYMGGGYIKPMGYQTGGYASALARARFGQDQRKALEAQYRQKGRLGKQQGRRGLFSALGSLGGAALGGLAATALAPVTGGASLLAGAALAKGLGSAGGSFLGEKLAEATVDTSGVGTQSSTGLYDKGFSELAREEQFDSEGAIARSLESGVKTGLMAGGSDALKSFAGKNIPGVGKLLNQSAGIGEGQIVNAAGEVVPISTAAVTDAARYTDQIMANFPTPPPTLGAMSGAGGASSAFNLGEGISGIGRGLEQFSDPVYPELSSFLPENIQSPQLGFMESPSLIPNQMFNQGGLALPKGIAPGGKRSYRRGASLDYLQKAEGNALRDAFKMADENKDIILGQARQRIADENALNMELVSSLKNLGEINRAEQDIAMAQEGSANLAQRAQAGQGMEYTNQIRDLLGTMQEGTERDLSFDSMNKIYPEGMESARTERFGGQTFSVPEVGMEEEGDNALLNNLISRIQGGTGQEQFRMKKLSRLGFNQGGKVYGYEDGGEANNELTFGEKFVSRFPSQHEDPERAMGQQRGLASIIDFLIPQSPLDVALSIAPVGAFGKIGKKAVSKMVKGAKKIPGKRSPYNEGRTNVDMQNYTDWTNYTDSKEHKERMLEEILSPVKRPLDTIYDEEGSVLDLVDILKSQGLQQGGQIQRYAGGGLINMLPFNRRIM